MKFLDRCSRGLRWSEQQLYIDLILETGCVDIHSVFVGSCCAAAGLRSVDLYVLGSKQTELILSIWSAAFGSYLMSHSEHLELLLIHFSSPIHTHFSQSGGRFVLSLLRQGR